MSSTIPSKKAVFEIQCLTVFRSDRTTTISKSSCHIFMRIFFCKNIAMVKMNTTLSDSGVGLNLI